METTTAAKNAKTIIRLDRENEAVAFRADPDVALQGLAEPVLLDEWQVVPEVLGAVKRAVDADFRPGRFLITGSVRADLQAETWPGTGRLVRLSMLGLTVAEQEGKSHQRLFLDRITQEGLLAIHPPRSSLSLGDYLQLALRSGFPELAFNMSERAQQRWLESYIDQLRTRDAEQLAGTRDPERLRLYFRACALNTAGVVDHKTIYETAGINRKTADTYQQVLANLLMIDLVPAWSTNRLKRLMRTPKRYVIDPGVAATLLGINAHSVLRDGDLLGRLLDTFVAAQIRSQIPACQSRPRLYHLRQEQGWHEVDLIVEFSALQILGIEIKADAAPGLASAKHLVWLQQELGERFIGGIVFHTGPNTYKITEDIIATPISTLWN